MKKAVGNSVGPMSGSCVDLRHEGQLMKYLSPC